MPIKKEWKEKWLKRLLSPYAKKAEGALFRNDGGMCCLGHFLDIQGVEFIKKRSLEECDKLGLSYLHQDIECKIGGETIYISSGMLYFDKHESYSQYAQGLTYKEVGELSVLNDNNDGFPIEAIEKLEEI